MRNNTSAIVIGCLIGLASCATLPFRHFAPKNANSGYHLGPSPLLAYPDYMHRFLNDQHSVLYMQNHGGGGVAVGVLLGPLGVIANIKMIQAQTESDATLLKNKGFYPVFTDGWVRVRNC